MSRKISRYEILEEIGQGGFAIVYRGRDTTLNRYVALKQLRPVLVRDSDWVNRFHHEARTIAQLDHPHIVPIYDVCEEGDRLFIVMRLVAGQSLESFIVEHGRLNWSETLEIISKVGEGLAYAHEQGVLHRDLKPANILIDPDRGPMLNDFGLAELIGEQGRSGAGDSSAIVGTPNYIAPEIWEGTTATIQSDIYALGCILFELLTGEKLFAGQTPPAIMKAHFSGFKFPDGWPADIPTGVQQILSRMLALNPAGRYTAVADILSDLRQIVVYPQAERSHAPKRPPQEPAPASARLRMAPILNTKLYVAPTRTHLIMRPRLIKQLEKGISYGRKLTLVVAPAGFGKTTLVSSWLNPHLSHLNDQDAASASLPVAWISLDESDNDPVRFFTYLQAALQNIDAAIGRNFFPTPPLPGPEKLAALLINDLTNIPDPFVLVLDDYHLISTGFIHEFVEFIIDHQPPQMHVVLTTREDPPLPLARYRARGQIIEIRQDDLRFTPAEAATFLNQTMNLKLTEEAINALEARTEGWIAGLQLAALSMQGRDEPHIADFIQAFSGSHRYVIDYLIEEVVLQQPKNIRQFLRQTAILDRFCAPLCNAVTDQFDSKLVLNYLEQVNLFLIPLDDERRWYRYHQLFAEFLQTELKPDQQKTLHQKASRWFESHNYLTEAIKHALAAEDFSEAGRLIALAADRSLHNGEFVTLNKWLEALPADFVRSHGELAIYKGWVAWIMGHVEEAVSYAASAEASLPANTNAAVRGKLIALQACLAISRDSDGLNLAQKAIPMLEETDPFYTGMALLVLGEAQNLLGDTAGAIKTLNEALRLGRKNNDYLMMVGAMINLAQQFNWQGKRRQAVELCQQALEYSLEAADRTSSLVGLAYLGLAEMELHTGNLSKTQAYLEKGQNMVDNQAMMGFQISAKLVMAPLQAALGETAAALQTVQEIHQIVQAGAYESYEPITAALEADYQLKASNRAAVAAWARNITLAEDAPMSIMREMELLTYVKWLLADGQIETAENVLALLEQSAQSSGRHLILLMTYLLQALVHDHRHETNQTHTVLEKAIRLAAPEEYREIFMQQGPDLPRLLPRVRHVAPAFVDSLLEIATDRFGHRPGPVSDGRLPGTLPGPEGGLVESLTERELEVLQLIATGKSNKEAAKTLVVTTGTVKKHLSNIFGKLGVNSRTQAIARARELQLIA